MRLPDEARRHANTTFTHEPWNTLCASDDSCFEVTLDAHDVYIASLWTPTSFLLPESLNYGSLN